MSHLQSARIQGYGSTGDASGSSAAIEWGQGGGIVTVHGGLAPNEGADSGWATGAVVIQTRPGDSGSWTTIHRFHCTMGKTAQVLDSQSPASVSFPCPGRSQQGGSLAGAQFRAMISLLDTSGLSNGNVDGYLNVSVS